MPANSIKLERYIRPGAPQVAVVKMVQESISNHDHDFFELVYLVDGYCLHDMAGRMTLLMAGDLFIIPPGKMHRYMCNHDVKLYNCLFTTEVFGSMLPKLLEVPGIAQLLSTEQNQFVHAHLELQDRTPINQLLESMIEEYNSPVPGWDIMLRSSMTSLIVQCGRIFSRHMTDSDENRSYMGYVTQALKYIDEHYTEELSIREVAESVGVSSDYFSRQFKQVTGIAPVEYLRRYRFAHAMELLAAGESVTDVSMAVGFRNLCHFSREFKNQLGVTPSQYRKQYAEQILMTEEE